MSQEKIGVDQWVEQYQQRRSVATGLRGIVERVSRRLPVWAWLVILVVLGFALPLVTTNNFVSLLNKHRIFTVHRDGLASGSCVRITPALATRMSDCDALAAAIRSLTA